MPRAVDVLEERCAGLPIKVKKMFGGHGFFAPNGGMFAGVVTDDAVILKLADGPARDELIALGGQPWVYHGRDKPMTMRAWIVVPETFYDDDELFEEWVRRAHRLVPGKEPTPRKKAKKAAPKRAR